MAVLILRDISLFTGQVFLLLTGEREGSSFLPVPSADLLLRALALRQFLLYHILLIRSFEPFHLRFLLNSYLLEGILLLPSSGLCQQVSEDSICSSSGLFRHLICRPLFRDGEFFSTVWLSPHVVNNLIRAVDSSSVSRVTSTLGILQLLGWEIGFPTIFDF